MGFLFGEDVNRTLDHEEVMVVCQWRYIMQNCTSIFGSYVGWLVYPGMINLKQIASLLLSGDSVHKYPHTIPIENIHTHSYQYTAEVQSCSAFHFKRNGIKSQISSDFEEDQPRIKIQPLIRLRSEIIHIKSFSYTSSSALEVTGICGHIISPRGLYGYICQANSYFCSMFEDQDISISDYDLQWPQNAKKKRIPRLRNINPDEFLEEEMAFSWTFKR